MLATRAQASESEWQRGAILDGELCGLCGLNGMEVGWEQGGVAQGRVRETRDLEASRQDTARVL